MNKILNKKILFLILIISGFISLYAQDKEVLYESAIESADTYYKNQDYINAKASYEYAGRLKPDETYPKTRLDETLVILRSQLEQRNKYATEIIAADKLFKGRKFEEAISSYQQAQKIFPRDGYPQIQIDNIKRIQVEEQEIILDYEDGIFQDEFDNTYTLFIRKPRN